MGDCGVVDGEGRIVTTGTTVHGFHTKFKEQVAEGDVMLIMHPVSLVPEERMITGILSSRSVLLHAPFSVDVVSTTDYKIRKDSEKLKAKAMKDLPVDAGEQEIQDATSKQLQKQLEKKIKKQKKTVELRVKTGMWGYKTVTVKLDKGASEEDRLDERCKLGRDKWC